MRVYVMTVDTNLDTCDYNETQFLGVYSTPELAMENAKGRWPDLEFNWQYDDDRGRSNYRVWFCHTGHMLLDWFYIQETDIDRPLKKRS